VCGCEISVLVAAGASTLPVWATVVIGLVGGGAVGGVVATLIQSNSARKEEWRTRLLSAADDYVQSFWLAHAQLWRLLDLSYKIQGGELRDEIDLGGAELDQLVEAEPLLRNVMLSLSRVALLFGGSSAAAEFARESRNKLRSAYNALDPQPDYPFADTSQARDFLNEAEKANDRFAGAARSAAITARTRG
jgi:hypothetical protein